MRAFSFAVGGVCVCKRKQRLINANGLRGHKKTGSPCGRCVCPHFERETDGGEIASAGESATIWLANWQLSIPPAERGGFQIPFI